MQSKWSQRLLALILVGMISLIGCGEDSNDITGDGGGGGGGGGDDTTTIKPASEWFQALADSLRSLRHAEFPGEYQTLRFDSIRTDAQAALDADKEVRVAHLALAILDLVELNYDQDLWALIDSMYYYVEQYAGDDSASGPVDPGGGDKDGLYIHPRSPILGNQFTILATAPRHFLRSSLMPFPANVTVGVAQQIAEDEIIPALNSAIVHLETAEAGEADSALAFLVQNEDEFEEIDIGEVYFFHAAVVAARAGFHVFTSYDWGLPGPDGTRSWVDDIVNMDRCTGSYYTEPMGDGSGNDRLVKETYGNETRVAQDSVAATVLRYNLESRADFLELKEDHMAAALTDLKTSRDLLEDAVTSIRNETDDQISDVIRFLDLTDIDGEIDEYDEPDFAQGFTSIEDVLDWMEEVLDGTPYEVTQQFQNASVTLSINIAAFLNSPPQNWADLLPYHEFKPENEWVSSVPGWEYTWQNTPQFPVTIWVCDDSSEVSNIAEVREVSRRKVFNALTFLESENGSPIDLNVDPYPYLPSYDFGGLFPGLDRAKWIEVHEATGWDYVRGW